VKEPKAADRHSDAECRHEGENDLNGELAVLHSDFLAKTFDLDSHKVNPETLFLVVSRHGPRHAWSLAILQERPLTATWLPRGARRGAASPIFTVRDFF
jgi:hypothetical protein